MPTSFAGRSSTSDSDASPEPTKPRNPARRYVVQTRVIKVSLDESGFERVPWPLYIIGLLKVLSEQSRNSISVKRRIEVASEGFGLREKHSVFRLRVYLPCINPEP